MNRFAELLDRLVLTPSRNGKLTLLVDYFRTVEDPDRGLALAAITGDLTIAAVKPAMLRMLVTERMDPVLVAQLDGILSESQAIEQAASLTRRYARRQVGWFGRYRTTHWISSGDSEHVALVRAALASAFGAGDDSLNP